MTGGGGKASKPLAGGQRSATTEKPPQKNHPEGWQPPTCERCPLSRTVSVSLLSADFAGFRRLVLSILYLRFSASSADLLFGFWSKPGLLREWAAALGQAGVRGAVSVLVSGWDFDTFFCVRVFLFDAVAQFL